MATTGERIRQARKARNMTQTELAEKLGVKFSAIHKYETGLVVNLKRETIAALAKALDVSPSWLMCLDDLDTQPSPFSRPRNYQHQSTILVDDFLSQNHNVVTIRGRDGTFVEKKLSDEQAAALKALIDQLPEAPDDL